MKHLRLALCFWFLCFSPGWAEQDYTAHRTELLEKINAFRHQHQLSPVVEDSKLSQAALSHSQDMAKRGFFEHSAPGDSLSFSERVEVVFGYNWKSIVENIYAASDARPTEFAKQVMDGWTTSEYHRDNLLETSVDDIGLGIAKDGSRLLVTAVLGRD